MFSFYSGELVMSLLSAAATLATYYLFIGRR
jgi:hypothetical protein